MKKHISIFLLSLMTSATMAQTADSATEPIQQDVAPKTIVIQNGDITYSMLDSIRTHATAIYASKVLYEHGYKLAYGSDVNQKEWRKYHLHEVAFATAPFDEKRKAWKVQKSQPFSYIRLVYDGANKRLCHYQVKFASREGFSKMHYDAVSNGYLFKSKKRDEVDKGIESTYYNAKTNCHMIFGEYDDGLLMVDMWEGDVRLGRAK